MATKVHMEALSPTMEEGQLVKWLKSEGDAVKEGDVLAEIETDKATMELVARGSGVLRKVLLAEGQTAPVGQMIAVIAAEDEDISSLGGGAAPAEAAPAAAAEKPAKAEERKEEPAPAPAPAAPAAAASEPAAARAPAGEDGGRVKASPLARRLASEAGVALEDVRGSGPGGRITKADIEAASARGAAPAKAAAAPRPRYTPAVEGPEVEEIPHTQMRKTIARRLAESIGPVPTFYLTIDVDATRLTDARQRVNARLEKEGVKASVNDFILKAVAMALARHPEVNASWGDDAIRRYRRVHVGVAVAVDEGLITPVIRDADRKGIADISVEMRELAERARAKRLKPEEYTGATFSVSNLGMFGIHEFTAIINPPEAGILAVGAAEERPVIENGEIVVRSRMKMTMSCDHRLIDGATGARFLQTLRDMLEEPMMMLS